MLHRNIPDRTWQFLMAQSVVAPHGSEIPVNGNGEARSHAGFWGLTLGSLGVVYGDIGTSPLYAFREAVVAAGGPGGLVSRGSVLGVLSLILWALILVVTVKYVLVLLRADNNGEGSTLTLMALALRAVGRSGSVVVLLGLVSRALFYGDALITPALSVLSAIEGMKVATPAFDPYVVPLTIVILLALFAVQSRGTGKVGALFGPITTVWFIAIAIPGIRQIAADPEVLWAFDPMYGLTFLASHGKIGLLTLGAVFLAVTGAEALYADLGHFGRRPIQSDRLRVTGVHDNRAQLDARLVLQRVGGLDRLGDRQLLGQGDEDHPAAGGIAQQLDHVLGLGPQRPAPGGADHPAGRGQERDGVARGRGVDQDQIGGPLPLQLLHLAEHQHVADARNGGRDHVEDPGSGQALGHAPQAVVLEILHERVVGRQPPCAHRPAGSGPARGEQDFFVAEVPVAAEGGRDPRLALEFHDEHRFAHPGSHLGQGRGHRRLAHATLAGDDEDVALCAEGPHVHAGPSVVAGPEPQMQRRPKILVTPLESDHPRR